MSTAMETALAALASALEGATAVEVIRNSDRPEALPAEGLVVLRDGEQVDAEASFSPLRYHITHSAEVIVMAQDEDTRDGIIADLVAGLVAARTLSGAVEWCQPEAVSLDLGDYEGAEAVRAARIPVSLYYTTLDSPAA